MSLNLAERRTSPKIAGGLVVVFAALLGTTMSGSAEVRFGKNVRIGGHDFSNQTYNSKRRAVIRLYDHTPRHAGCVWRSDGRGGKVKICNLRSLR
jgi:hypothetical protein